MTYDEFHSRLIPLVEEQSEDLYALCSSRSWPEVEPVLRKQLSLRNAFRHPPMSTEKYMNCLNGRGQELFHKLKLVRTRLAKQLSVPPYTIFQNRTLYEMTVLQPTDLEGLMGLYGVGRKNAALYGGAFLSIIQEAVTDGSFPALKVSE